MKQVRAFLTMEPVGGAYPVPTSEAAYKANINLIDVAIPSNAGMLQADGSWQQVPAQTQTEFAQELPTLVRNANQRYVPSATGDSANVEAVLRDESRWQVAADGLVTLATTRFDAPWDGVHYDIPAVDAAYIELHEQFIGLLSLTVRNAGLPFEVSFHGIRQEIEAWAPSLGVIRQVSDAFDYYMYGFWPPEDGLWCPFWNAVASLDNAVRHEMAMERVFLGVANYARYWPDTGEATFHQTVYDQAKQIAQDANARWEWVEQRDGELIREKLADLGAGHIWLEDGDTVRVRLELADKYGLGGMMLFTPGMGDSSVWDSIRAWKHDNA